MQTALPYVWYFFIYAFLGWCTEVAFAALKNGRFVNRGFLSGPICPIYGFGLVGVLLCLSPIQNNLLLLYLGSVVLTTVLELITGFFMEKLFHQRWWDYSKMPLNIGGYVCLPFSLVWGVACVAIVAGLQPLIARLVAWVPAPFDLLLPVIFTAFFLLDTALAIAKALRLDSRLSQIDELSAALRVVSDRLGETVAGGALALKATDERARDDLNTVSNRAREADEKKRAELKVRYTELLTRFERDHRRFLNAFPALRSVRHPAAMSAAHEKLPQILKNRVRKHKK